MKTLKKYYVENAVLTPAQWNGYEPYDINDTDNYVGDFVEAESEEEAIMLAMDYLMDNMSANVHTDYDNRTMQVFDYYGELISVYCNFRIKNVK